MLHNVSMHDEVPVLTKMYVAAITSESDFAAQLLPEVFPLLYAQVQTVVQVSETGVLFMANFVWRGVR
jgi:hypothetical protein